MGTDSRQSPQDKPGHRPEYQVSRWFGKGEGDALAEEMLKLESLVGQALVCFSRIEHFTYACLKMLPSENIYSVAATLPFSKRVDLIVSILESKPNPYKEKMAQQLQQAKILARERNLIAHNPIYVMMDGVDLDDLEAADEILLRPAISAVEWGPTRTADTAALEKFIDSTLKLESELNSLIPRAFAEESRIAHSNASSGAGERGCKGQMTTDMTPST